MQRVTVSILLALALLAVAALWLVAPIPQPLWYHDFADKRLLFGIPNFWNVTSNLPFWFVGAWGIWYSASGSSPGVFHDPTERWMCLFLFAGVALTGTGSAYYHLDPNNDRLVWDRLPIAVTLMALLAIIIAERASRRAGVALFLPLVLLGAATVFYWHLTESWGRGDLRPYLLAQLYPAVAIPVILWLNPARYTGAGRLYSAMAWYISAKIYEFLDKDLYSFGQVVSGHTLKHVGAGVASYMILSWVRHRQPIDHQIQPTHLSFRLVQKTAPH
jgi:hypothetical protein